MAIQSDNLFEIDISQRKKEEDLIPIRFKNDEVHQVNFSKLVSQSKYIRDKYKYSEAVELINEEFQDIIAKLNISEESIKHFIELIETEKVTVEIGGLPYLYIVVFNYFNDFFYKWNFCITLVEIFPLFVKNFNFSPKLTQY